MKKILILFFVFMINISYASAKHLFKEKYYQSQWCGKWHGIQEYKLKDNTRVDCLTKNYAVEFDFAPKWAEGFGQAKYYAEMTGKKPAVILIIEKPSDWKHYNRLKTIAAKNGVTLWYMKSPTYSGTSNNVNIDTICNYFAKIFAL